MLRLNVTLLRHLRILLESTKTRATLICPRGVSPRRILSVAQKFFRKQRQTYFQLTHSNVSFTKLKFGLTIRQAVNSILRHVAAVQGFKTNEELENLYRKTAWRFEAKTGKKGSSYDWFKQVIVYFEYGEDLVEKTVRWVCLQAVQEPSLLDECDLDEGLKRALLDNIKQKLTQQAVKIRADIEVI